MIQWADRTSEERALLNPAFCSQLLWQASLGYSLAVGQGLPFEQAFVVLPFVLHSPTRAALPRDARTSLAVWLARNPLARGKIVERARLLVPFTREALIFGSVHRLLELAQGRVHSRSEWAGRLSAALDDATDDARDAAKRAEFVGRWLAKAGNSATVLALLGVRP